MPRKYRPPTSRRRKSKKTVEYDFPAGEEAASEAAVAEDEYQEEEPTPVVVSEAVARGADGRPERHVNRDYAHVGAEAVRIAIIGGIIIIAIIVGGFFR